MNPLARLMAARGCAVQGSDRDFDRGRNERVAELLREAGVELLPQDGSAITAGLARVVHSAAVEPTVPEMVAAREHGIECVARPQLLAEVLNAGSPGVAIAGTSGKSTVTGMVAWILRQTGRAATVLGGAALAEQGANHMGCFAAAGDDAPVVAEACESDGTLVGYRPGIGVILNMSRDHHELDALAQQFGTFAANSAQLVVNADCPHAQALAAEHAQVIRFGRAETNDLQLDIVRPGPEHGQASLVTADEQALLELPQPGEHNLENAAAACAVALALAVPLRESVAALASFPGVARRFQQLGITESGIRVVDDYAHNGAKIAAAVAAAQLGCDRLIAVFQPHGFGPARFLRDELRAGIPQWLRPADRWAYLPIYDAGGTTDRSISSEDLAADLPPDLRAVACADHAAALTWIAENATPGSTVLIMGARDPRLGDFAATVFDLL